MTKILVRFVKFRMTDNLEIHKVKERIKMNNTKQTQDDRTIQPFNCSTIQRVKAYAFTLAETLIVIGIIGVVAALTLPNLNHATGDKEKVTKVKKIYSALNDAYGRAEAIYGPIDEWFSKLEHDNTKDGCKLFAKRITEFLKTSKDCGFDEGCFSSAPLLAPNGLGGENTNYDDNYLEALQNYPTYMVMLSDGTSLGFQSYYHKVLVIRVDIDGPTKGKNQIGNDCFNFSIGLNSNDKTNYVYRQLLPEGAQECINYIIDNGIDYTISEIGGYTTAWVINYDNMDYMKCPNDLKWGTVTSCN